MKNVTSQLHIVMGSFAAMLVAFLSLINGTSPSTCLMKAMAAFLVFGGFGLVIRFILAEAIGGDDVGGQPGGPGMDSIVPGTSVADLLAAQMEDADSSYGAEESAAA